VAAKHGVVGLGQALNQEIAQNDIQGVHVCTVMPIAHDTPFFDHAANYSGHEIQTPSPLHEPANVVDTLLRLAVNPKDEQMVGADGMVKSFLERIAPPLMEKLGAKRMHRLQYENAPSAADTSGAVRAPMPRGTDVSGGRLARR